MVTITFDPPTTTQNGAVSLAGDAPGNWTMQWWYNNEVDTNTTGFTRDGSRWYLDLPIFSKNYSLHIRAALGNQVSNTITYTFNSGVGSIQTTNHVNEFDELGLEEGIERITGESNRHFRDRLLTTYTMPCNSTRQGLVYNLEKRVGLPHLNPFFSLSARFNFETFKEFNTPIVQFNLYSADVYFTHWVANAEILDIDRVTGVATPKNIIVRSSYTPIEISNAGNIIDGRFYDIDTDTNTVTIDLARANINLDAQVLITYPYKKRYEYFYVDEITGKRSERTVLEVKEWLTSVDEVEDHTTATVGSISWSEGYYVPATVEDEALVEFTARSSLQDLYNYPANTDYVKITEAVTPFFLRVERPFPNKGFFKATCISPTPPMTLTRNPVLCVGSWFRLDALHDKDFQDLARADVSDRNIAHYAKRLRGLTRMGINNTLIDFDYWGSDSPDKIGENYLRSYFDANLVDHIILTAEGHEQNISLNERNYYAKKLRAMYR